MSSFQSENQFEHQQPPPPQPPSLRPPLATIPDPCTRSASAPRKFESFSSTATPNRPCARHKLQSPNTTPAPKFGGPKAGGGRVLGNKAAAAFPIIAPASECFQLVQDPDFWTDHNVQVLIRIRPISSTERALQGNATCLKQENSQTLSWLGPPETRFTFDHIASHMISQDNLFMVAGLPMVDNCMSGYNSCMFAYGQTGSGKTYTMMGDIHDIDGTLSESCGITPRIFEYLFMRISDEEERRRDEKLKYTCKCSFLEIYNEQITDLLEPSSTNLQLREDLGKGVYVENLVEYEVTTVKDVLQLLFKGAANRKIAATNMNSESSRSHSVFTCIIESRRIIDSVTHLRFGRLNLVDLAGSERQKSSGAEGERLKEAANINKSLSTLGLVIMTLVDVAHGKHRHIPYRDSRLTFLLQDSLGGNSKTTIIANISPSICAANETLSTLKFAQRAKLIQNNAKVNEDAPTDVMALQQQVQLLKDQLSFLLKHQNFSKPQTVCGPKLEQSQSGVLGENYDSSLEGKMSDFPKRRTFPEETMRCIRATLVGALRREKVADTSLRRLQAEIEHMNRLVRQREEDAQRTKLMLRFREEKIKRLELLSDGFISADEYLMEENRSLSEEIQLLQARIDRNPELTQFALENVRLIEQLRMFQDFYEQDEREILWAEVSELRDQLIETVQGNYELLKSGTINQQGDKPAGRELDDCRRNLDVCLEINAKLTREIDELQRQLNTYKGCSSTESASYSVPSDTGTIQPTRRQSLVEIMPIRNQSEEKIAVFNQDDEVSQIKNGRKIDDTVDLQPSDPAEELMHAKSVIEAMEYEQLRLIEELNILQTENFHYVKLLEKNSEERTVLHKLENNFDQQCNTKDSDPGDAGIFMKGTGNIKTTFTLEQKLEGLKRDLDQARIMNKRYLDDQGSQIFHQSEFEQICQQVEVETAKVILHLQEELASLQEELQDKMISMNRENSRLRNTIESKEDEIQMLSKAWESATLQLTSFLVDGCRSLEDASEQVGSIARSFPERKAWISEHVEKAANSFLEKERTIVQLQKSLEDAQKLGSEMKLRLSSLKGATLAITEMQQLERNENSREIIQLNTLLSQKKAKIEELEKRLEQIQDQIVGGNIRVNDAQGRGSLIHNYPGENTREGFSQLAIPTTASQRQLSELKSEETEAGSTSTSEVVHLKFSGPVLIGEENNKMISSFLGKFEEAQDMVKEADDMLNALLKANENAKYMTHRWKEVGEELMMERVHLIEEIQQLKSSICLKEEQYESIEVKMQSSLDEIAFSLSSLEHCFLQMQRDVEESFKVVYSDIFSLRQDLLGFIRKLSLSLEDIWAEIMENGFALFVFSQCYTGKLFEKISTLKLESDLFTSRGKHCCSVINNVGEECAIAIGGSSVSKGAKCIKGYLTENLHHTGRTLELKPSFDMVPEEEKIVLNPVHLISENLSLKKELVRKDVVLKGLLFDISLLQESTSSSKDIKDEVERISESLTLVRHELEVKTTQLDELLLQNRKLETQADDCEAALCISNSKLRQANETIEILSKKNSDLIAVLDTLYAKKFTVEEKLEERKEVVKGLEEEILRIASSVDEKQLSSVEDIKDEVRRLTAERKHLQEEIISLNDRLQMASALADENEAIAIEARQESEASKVYAEQKEEEAKILEHSVEELESTINVLEKKVSDMSTEVERHYKMNEDLEMELQALKLRMLTVENFTEILDPGCSDFGQKEYQTSRILIERGVKIEELRKQVRILEKERADQAIEIKECKDYISELLLHAEAQASQYQLKYKTLESMIRGMKTDPSTSTSATPLDKTDKSLMRTRGSSSPFRCIASLVQQMKLEKDQEMLEAMLKIGELEALACSRQKEICMLNTRLAAAENMTHDVIRDLLGVKLDMTNYANLIDGHHVQNLLEEAQDQTEKFIAKEQENIKLRKKIDMLTEEGQSYLEELNKKEADILAAQVTLEQLKQRDQMLAAQNEMLKMDKINLKKKIAEMDEILKKNHGALNFQQSMKMKDNNLKSGDEELRKRLANVNGELALYAKPGSRDPHERQEHWLRIKCQDPPEFES